MSSCSTWFHTANARSLIFYAAATLIITGPRIARMIYPELMIEDDFYLQSAFLISAGEQPYNDFTLNHFPLLEFMLAGLLRLFSNPLMVAETFTQVCIAINTLVVLCIGTRLDNRRTGLAAAALYGCSALIFKYHLYEREVFATTFIVTGLYCWFFMRGSSARAVITALLFCAASLVKLTCIVPFAALLLWACRHRQYRLCCSMLATCALSLAACSCALYALYGREFIFQVYIFHFMKGCRSLPGRIECFVNNTDITVFLGVLGLLFYRPRDTHGHWGLIKLLMLAYPVFFIFISSTVWPHNLLEMLISAALVGGAFISRMLQGIPKAARSGALMKIIAPRPLLISAAAAVSFFLIQPWEIEGARDRLNHSYGFGAIPRSEIREASGYIQEHTRPDDYICSPVPLVAFASSRKTVLNYWESTGVEAWLRERIAHQGLWRTFLETRKVRFVDLIAETSLRQTQTAFRRQALLKKPVLVVKPDFPGEEPFGARLALGIIDEYAGNVLFRNRFFIISECRMRAPDGN